MTGTYEIGVRFAIARGRRRLYAFIQSSEVDKSAVAGSVVQMNDGVLSPQVNIERNE